ncbi:MAG: hypothetical protein N2504_01670 [candidate division WOR-3 bacterium]|nr:hypothetical protein [candidate division WOR-3 bacterium]MCX7947279.1 hypothetical protein [candidate division WOR-3 bacterium]MDW8150164.1 hypothetical protein [candidate division WOR-3 bacterium]
MRRLFNIFITLLFFNACATTEQRPRTQLEIREYQTRYFQVNDKKTISKAILNVLLDEGFVIKNSDLELGIITAERAMDAKEKIEEDSKTNWAGVLLIGALVILTVGLILLLSKDKDKDEDRKDSGSGSTSSPSNTTYEKSKILETTVSFSEYSDGYKVRAVFQYKVYDNEGKLVRVKNLDDANYYQNFFSKLDKSIFLQKELENK